MMNYYLFDQVEHFFIAVRFGAETARQMIESRNPLTLTLSPQSRGEGIRSTTNSDLTTTTKNQFRG